MTRKVLGRWLLAAGAILVLAGLVPLAASPHRNLDLAQTLRMSFGPPEQAAMVAGALILLVGAYLAWAPPDDEVTS